MELKTIDPEPCKLIVEAPLRLFEPDPLRLFLPTLALNCAESLRHVVDDEEDDEGSVLFQCTVANHRLAFRCRDRSTGVLIHGEQIADAFQRGTVDPFFFDKNYSLFASTGFQIWPGSRILIEALTSGGGDTTSSSAIFASLRVLQEQIRGSKNGDNKGRARILELGSGLGVVGTALAAAGAQVLLTDLPTLVHNGIDHNLLRNEVGPDDTLAPPSPASDSSSTIWPPRAIRIGNGWAGSAVLDWTIPLEEQLDNKTFGTSLQSIDLVVSCDGLLLASLYESTLDIVASIFALSPHAKFLMTYQRRGPNKQYTTIDQVLGAIQSRGWTSECLAWRNVNTGKDGTEDSIMNDLFLFQVINKMSSILEDGTSFS